MSSYPVGLNVYFFTLGPSKLPYLLILAAQAFLRLYWSRMRSIHKLILFFTPVDPAISL